MNRIGHVSLTSRNYNVRSRKPRCFDPNREFPNEFQFMIYDQRIVETVGSRTVSPLSNRRIFWRISFRVGIAVIDLAQNIVARVQRSLHPLVRYELDTLRLSHIWIHKSHSWFNQCQDCDPDFGRGSNCPTSSWHAAQMARHRHVGDETHPENPYPNSSLPPSGSGARRNYIGFLDIFRWTVDGFKRRVVDKDFSRYRAYTVRR